MKTAFITAACVVACLFFLEAHGHQGRFQGAPRGPPPPVNETEVLNDTSRPVKPPGGPRRPMQPPGGPRRPRPPPGGPHRPLPPFPAVNETDDSSDTPRPEKRFPGHPHGNKTKDFSKFFSVRYGWFRRLDENTTVSEGAGIKNGSEVIFVKSRDPQLEDKGFNKSSITYDFTNNTAIVIYSFERKFVPCFVEDTTLTYDEVSNDVASKNGSTVESSNIVSKTANPLSETEEEALRESNRVIYFVCRGRPIYRLTLASDGQPSDTDTGLLVFFNLNAQTKVTYPKPTGPPAGGRPDRRGEGGRGKGGRGGKPKRFP